MIPLYFFRDSELVILLTGAKMRSLTEFVIHTGETLKAVIDSDAIKAIPWDDNFSVEVVQEMLLADARQRLRNIAAFAAELLHTSTVYETYQKTMDNEDSVLVEITSIVGYCVYVSYTLNVFRMPLKYERKRN